MKTAWRVLNGCWDPNSWQSALYCLIGHDNRTRGISQSSQLSGALSKISVPRAKHIYAALESDEHIRLIILHPSEDSSAPLTCSIQQAKLDDGDLLDYEPISYTWGAPIFSHHLFCYDGSVFAITPNLHDALTRFRLRDRARYLWADSISINQSDLAEKSRQIPLMARIYHSASRVLVWLGNGEGGEANTMGLLSRLTRSSSVIHEHTGYANAVGPKTEITLLRDLEPIWKFTGLPWFSRRWIIQEVSLNPDVVLHCGAAELSWPRFILALEILAKYLDEGTARPAGLDSLLKLGSLWRTWTLLDDAQKDCELLDLLDSFHHFGCAEEKDRLFALVGLATDVRTTLHQDSTSRRMSISTDYSLSVGEVYRTFALQRMQSGRVFSTLSDAAERRTLYSQQHLFPSWVPDLKKAKRHASRIADSRSLASVVFCPDDNTLLLKTGIYAIDDGLSLRDRPAQESICIKDLGPIGIAEATSQNIFHWVRGCFQYLKQSVWKRFQTTDERIMAALCKLLVNQTAGMFLLDPRMIVRHRELDHIDYDDVHIVDEELTNILFPMLRSSAEIPAEELGPFEPFLDLVSKTMSGRRLFLGSPGPMDVSDGTASETAGQETASDEPSTIIGFGPEDLQQGDLATAFMGDGVPCYFFLRPVGGGAYRLLGEAYVVSLRDAIDTEGRWVMCGGAGRNVEIVLV